MIVRPLLFLSLFALLSVWSVSVSGVSLRHSSPFSTTLLEHSVATNEKFAPTPRNRLEKLKLTQTPRIPQFLGAKVDQLIYHNADARGGASDAIGNQEENRGRAREPQMDHFEEDHGAGSLLSQHAGESGPSRAPREGDRISQQTNGPVVPLPQYVPPPPPPHRPSPPHIPEKEPKFPTPPNPTYPLPSPPTPDCGELCSPASKDPTLVRVPFPPLGDQKVGDLGLEGKVLKEVLDKIQNREGWLDAQKEWLGKAITASATLRSELEQAHLVQDAVASELEQLKLTQDHLSIRYKANRLKWSFKDKKITLEKLKEKLEELEHAKADIGKQIREAKDEVTVLETTLGPPSQQVQITPAELDQPLEFIKDITAEDDD